MALSSSSGRVTVDLPASQGFELDANSSSGGIDVDLPITVSGTVDRRTLRIGSRRRAAAARPHLVRGHLDPVGRPEPGRNP
jgi:hypothetical protein